MSWSVFLSSSEEAKVIEIPFVPNLPARPTYVKCKFEI